jgi:hypothetical protein
LPRHDPAPLPQTAQPPELLAALRIRFCPSCKESPHLAKPQKKAQELPPSVQPAPARQLGKAAGRASVVSAFGPDKATNNRAMRVGAEAFRASRSAAVAEAFVPVRGVKFTAPKSILRASPKRNPLDSHNPATCMCWFHKKARGF